MQCILSYTFEYMDAYIHACIHAYMVADTFIYTHAHAYMHTYIHAFIHTFFKHTCTHSHRRANTHMRSHIHTSSSSLLPSRACLLSNSIEILSSSFSIREHLNHSSSPDVPTDIQPELEQQLSESTRFHPPVRMQGRITRSGVLSCRRVAGFDLGV